MEPTITILGQTTLNDLFKYFREARMHFSTLEMARMLACDLEWLHNFENGRVDPKDATIYRVRDQFSLMSGIAVPELEQLPIVKKQLTNNFSDDFVANVNNRLNAMIKTRTF